MDNGILADWVKRVLEEADKAHANMKHGNNPEYQFEQGKALAYYDVITSLKDIVDIHYPEALDEYGLDFDPDKRFLSLHESKTTPLAQAV